MPRLHRLAALACIAAGAGGAPLQDHAMLEYCSHAPQWAARAVPAPPTAGSTLRAVAAVSRHGARAPAHAYECWPGYSASLPPWDCDRSKQLMAPWRGAPEFEIAYDGAAPEAGNPLGGTCVEAQLLDEGLAQAVANGNHLRAAYRAHLLKVPRSGLYLRSTNLQRTLATGMATVSTLLNGTALVAPGAPPLPWHTADLELEYLYPNDKICPGHAASAHAAALASAASAAFNSSLAALAADSSLFAALGGPVEGWHDDYTGAGLDCLATTVCARDAADVPSGLASGSVLADAWAVLQKRESFEWRGSDAGDANAKLVSAGTVRELLRLTTSAGGGRSFSFIAAHDTLLMALLAALGVWDAQWPPYASMLVLEVYDVHDGAAFRLVYNGDVVTSRVEGCKAALCPIAALEAAAAFALPGGAYASPCDERQGAAAAAALAHGTLLEARVLNAGGRGTAAVVAAVGVAAALVLYVVAGSRRGGQAGRAPRRRRGSDSPPAEGHASRDPSPLVRRNGSYNSIPEAVQQRV